tara:strand:- start:3983 stop:6058 length:2076 start_codon:yes stop_codon:yes gene_type:complete
MAIKIYETQIRPTAETGQVTTTPGMRVSQATGAAIGKAIKGTAKSALNLYAEIETRKSENEVLEKSAQLLQGNENFEGLSMATQKAGMMDDPDAAIKYYNDAFEIAKNNVGLDFKHRYSKKLFDQYLKKQQIKDGLVVRKNSNAAFIAKSQSLELSEIEKLKKDIVYGETENIKNLAKIELDNKLNSDKFNNLFGAESETTKNSALQDIEFYKAKRQIDVNAEEGLKYAIKNINDLDLIDKLKAYAGKTKTTKSENNKEILKTMESQLDDFTIPDITTLNNVINDAVATNDEVTLKKAQKILVEGDVLSNLKTMNYQELQNANSAAIRLKEGADPDTALRSEITRDYYNKINANLKKDPITTAKNIGLFNNISPLPISDLINNPGAIEDISRDISQRVVNAKAVSAFYGTQTKYFTEDEKDQLTDFFETSRNKTELYRVLGVMNKNLGVDAGPAFREIAPKNPFFAYIGGLANQTGITGEGFKKAIAGYDVVKNKKINPGIKKSESTYKKTVANYREAFPDSPETYNAIIEAAEYIYAYEMYKKEETDITFKKDIFENAIQLAAGSVGDFGGIDQYNDTYISIPSWLEKGTFSNVVEALKEDKELLKQALGNQEGIGVSMRDGSTRQIDIFKNNPNPEFIAVGNGRYKISLGDHPYKGAPRYVMTNNFDIFKGTQKPLILDLNLIKSKIQE